MFVGGGAVFFSAPSFFGVISRAKKAYTVSAMPTAVTHQLLAEEAYKLLPRACRAEISSLPHYYFGAQGCDVLFFYRPLSSPSDNFGRALHAADPAPFFRILFEEAQKNKEVKSYALGYITHYAGDVAFHERIYSLTRGKEKRLTHHAAEHAFDGALASKLRGKNLAFVNVSSPKKAEKRAVYNVYARYACDAGLKNADEREFLRAVRRYYAFARFRLPLFRKKYTRQAEELFLTAKEESVRLIKAFLAAKDAEVAGKYFKKSFLSGKIARKK